MYLDYYLMGIILLPGILFAFYAQYKVNSTFKNYSEYFTASGLTAADFLKRLLTAANMNDISIERTPGELTDHYDPKNKRICLSDSVYNSNSVASLGIACHEFGHALQKKEKYAPYQIRRILIPVTNFVSNLLWPLVVIGLIFNFAVLNPQLGDIFMWSGIAVFGLSVLVNLATLPVEFNASKRAVKILQTTGIMNDEEIEGTKKVLGAAALTYVAALTVSILSFLRFLLVVLARRRD